MMCEAIRSVTGLAPTHGFSMAWRGAPGRWAIVPLLLCAGGCIGKSLASSPCGLVTSATEAQPGELSVAGSFTVNGFNQLVLVLTTGPATTRQYPATAMTGTTALIPLTSPPPIPHGTYPATWIMRGCETPDQTHLIGPDSVTVAG